MRESWELTSPFARVVFFTVLFFLIVTFLGLVLILKNWRGTVMEGDEVVEQGRLPSIREVIRQQNGEELILPMGIAERSVLNQHFDALGGVEKISSALSIRFSGRVEFNEGETLQVVAIKKGGEWIRITTKNPQLQRSIVLTPDDQWSALFQNGELVDVADLSPEETDEQRRYIYVASELYLAMQNSWDIHYLGEKDFNYKMAHVFEVEKDSRHRILFYIDPKTFLDVGREDRVFEEDGTLSITRRIHSEHFDSNGMKFPGLVEVYLDGELLQVFRLDQAEINPGVLQSSFERPELPKPPEEPAAPAKL